MTKVHLYARDFDEETGECCLIIMHIIECIDAEISGKYVICAHEKLGESIVCVENWDLVTIIRK